MNDIGEITQLLKQLDEKGTEQRAVLDRLLPLVYGELRALARANRFRWSGGRGPGTTSLVHEAYLRLAGHELAGHASRRQFFFVASKAMRSILVDNARWHGRQKRGGGAEPAALEESMLISAARSEELLALDDGLSVDETAEALAVSPATVKRGWTMARTWLYRELQGASI
jgi:RNA polymerase sigma factor (TIGR02999 family)